jgi:pimeloyl-ACP methyl ester carboxylesterase
MPASRLAAIQKSTIVRSFSVLERVAPAVGAGWAEHLWFTVPRARSRSDRLLAPGRPFHVPVNGHTVAGEVWDERPVDGTPEETAPPIVYLVHGWGGWGRQLEAFVGPLVERGHRVVTFDAPSHGASDPGPTGPGRSTILEFADALAAVVAANGPAHALVAHSLGATSAAFAMRGGLAVERTAFVAPMADPLPYTRTFAGRLGFGERVRTRLVDRIERRVGMPLSAFDVPAMAGQVPTPPLLLVHDRQDAETGWSDSAAIARSWPHARLVTTSGLGHRRILRAPAVVTEVVEFVAAAPAGQSRNGSQPAAQRSRDAARSG